jgi:beta-glucosidase
VAACAAATGSRWPRWPCSAIPTAAGKGWRCGSWLLGASGLGRLRLTVADRVAFDTVTELPTGADPVEGLMRPPQRWAPVELHAGDEVPVTLRYQPRDTGGFGDTEVAVVTFQLNLAKQFSDEEELERAVSLAAEADVAVMVVGTTEEVESEGFDRDTLALPGRQDELVRRVAAANPRSVVVVNAGAPVPLPWADQVPAVLVAWFPGQEFGNALADVLLGDREPGGRLPTVWPGAEHHHLPSTRPVGGALDYAESIHVGNCGYDRAQAQPAFPFGHGLGYTTWEYLDVTAPPRVDADGDAVLTVRVRNTGTRPVLGRPAPGHRGRGARRWAGWLGGDVEQAGAQRPGGAEEGAAAAVGVQGAQQQPVEAVEQERGGRLGIVDGELAGLGAAGDEPDQVFAGPLERFVLGDLGGVEEQVVEPLVAGVEVVHLAQERA